MYFWDKNGHVQVLRNYWNLWLLIALVDRFGSTNKIFRDLAPKCFVCFGQNLGGHLHTLPTHFLCTCVLWCKKTATEITISYTVYPPHCVLNGVLRGHFLEIKVYQWNISLRSFMSNFGSFWSPCLTSSERDV